MIHYNAGSKFFCDRCKKILTGEGYLYYGKTVCTKHYKGIFPNYDPQRLDDLREIGRDMPSEKFNKIFKKFKKGLEKQK